MLKSRIKKYIEATGVPMARFCKRIDLSVSAINRYLRDDLKLSMNTEQRIKDYLEQFGF